MNIIFMQSVQDRVCNWVAETDSAPNDIKNNDEYNSIQIIQPTRCNSFTSLLLDVYMCLNMFRVSPRPSSGAYNCTKSLWFYRWREAAGALLVISNKLVKLLHLVGWIIWIVWWCTDLRTSNLWIWSSSNLFRIEFTITWLSRIALQIILSHSVNFLSKGKLKITNELWAPWIWAVCKSSFVRSLHNFSNTESVSVTRAATSYKSSFSTWFQLFGVSCILALRWMVVHTLTGIFVSKHDVWPAVILRSNLKCLALYDVPPLIFIVKTFKLRNRNSDKSTVTFGNNFRKVEH